MHVRISEIYVIWYREILRGIYSILIDLPNLYKRYTEMPYNNNISPIVLNSFIPYKAYTSYEKKYT